MGLGGGRSLYLSGTQLEYLQVTQKTWRMEAEAGYYAGWEGFDVLLIYGENLSKPRNTLGLTREQHAALMGEYRLFMLNESGTLQGAAGLGPSLTRFHYYAEDEVIHRPVRFKIDVGLGLLYFATRHLLIRGQAIYSFPPLHPLYGGTLNLTLRANYRS